VTPSGNGQPAPVPSTVADRLNEVIALTGDTKGVIRAKTYLREHGKNEDFGQLSEDEWRVFLAEFALTAT